uniref:Uncharacterized protein n=1 Tax=Anguilla anguilla TaxID=7936 RepID=A0A0E9W192_ANGAN
MSTTETEIVHVMLYD